MKFVLSASFVPTKDIPKLAVAAEQAGWHGISFSDHVVHPKDLQTPYPYTKDGKRRWDAFTDWPDPQVMIGALSTITDKIEFMNNVFVLPIRNPLLVAKAVATNAVLSNNRVNFCIGIGWSKDEYQILEQDFHTRGKRCDESIEILRKVWKGGWVKHDGQHYSFPELEMTPVPDKHIPIWVGGMSDFALKRAARLCDGWISDLQPSADIIRSVEKINAYRKEYGRDHLPFSVKATPNDVFTPDGYKAMEEAGVTHIMSQPWHFYHQAPFTLESQIDSLYRYADDIIKYCE